MLTTRYILDESHLSHYDERLKSWVSSQPVKTLPSSLYPWTQTDKAGAVTCWPVGGTQLKPTVDFMFTEVPPASGDKGPDNPSTISGVSNIEISKITGKNLLPYNFRSATVKSGNSGTAASVTFSQTNGVYSFSGTATGLANVYISHITEDNILILEPGTYTLSGYTAPANAPTGTDLRIQLNEIREDGSRNMYRTINCIDGSETFTIDRKSLLNVYIRTSTGTVYPAGFVCSPQLEFGDTATVYEPSTVDYYTLPLGGTYYGGTLDVASGVMTVTHEKVLINTFNFVQAVYTATVLFGFDTAFDTSGYTVGQTPTWVCDKLGLNGNSNDEYARQTGDSSRLYISIDKSRLDVSSAADPGNPTNAEWLAAGRSWVASNVLTFIAERKTPATVQLTPAQILSLSQPDKYVPRLNTVYADAQAVQVGYVKSPIREEYELTQAIVGQGGSI